MLMAVMGEVHDHARDVVVVEEVVEEKELVEIEPVAVLGDREQGDAGVFMRISVREHEERDEEIEKENEELHE